MFMKIYISFDMRDERGTETARLIAETLEGFGHTIVNGNALDESAAKKDGILSKFWRYENSIRMMRQSDCIIAEIGQSFGTGYELGYALASLNKKVFMLYDKKLEKDAPVAVTGNSEPNAIRVPYTDAASLKGVLAQNFKAIEVKA